MKSKKAQKGFFELVKYGIVGVMNTAITFIVFKVLILIGSTVLFANFAGYTLGILNSFYMNRKFTFKSDGSLKKQGLLFSICFGISYVLQLGALYIFKDYYKINLDLSQGLAMVIFTLINFVLNKIFTFKKQEAAKVAV